MSDETQDHPMDLDTALIESGWQKPVSPPMSMVRPPGMLPKPATQTAAASTPSAPANSDG